MVAADLCRELVRAGRDLYRQGMMAGSSGNLSARLDQERVIITPSGIAKGRLRPSDLMVVDLAGRPVDLEGRPVDLAGRPVDPRNRPSSETSLHLAIYRRFSHVQSVIHAHPLRATALAAAHRPITTKSLPEAIFALGSIAMVPYIPSTDPALGEAVAGALDEGDGALLLNHGAVTIGRSVEAAKGKMEILEALSDIEIQTALLGGAVSLPTAEIERLRAIWRHRRG